VNDAMGQDASWYPSDPLTCAHWADALVVVHSAVVLFVVLGELVILLGAWRRWRWTGNRWFRGSHLLVIAIVTLVAGFQRLCPLTVWENELRRRAGQATEATSFVGRWLRDYLYVDVDLRLLAASYVAFGLLVFASLFIAPVRWRKRRAEPPETHPD